MSEILSKISYDLPVAYTDGTTPYSGEHIARTHKDLRVQVPGALASLGYGIKAVSASDRGGLKVTIGTGLQPAIAPGMAIVPSNTLVPAFIELVSAVTLDALEANRDSDNPLYLYARQNSTTSPETGLARFVVSDVPDGEGLLLASITTGASAILTITDLRPFLGEEGQFRLRGAYSSGTTYFAGGVTDVVSVAGTLYYSLQNNNTGHTPASSPLWWAAFGSGSGLPVGGDTGQILAKDSDDDGDAVWIDAPVSLPTGGSTGQILAKSSDDDGDADWVDAPSGGPAGAAGSQWRTGGGVPSNSLGIDGDFYVDTLSRNVYQKVGGAYVVKFSMVGAGYGGTSASSVTVGTGSKTFATQSNLAYNVGSLVRATKTTDTAVFMQGQVTNYSGGNLTLNVTLTGGAETASDWAFTLVGPTGASGSSANTLLFANGVPSDASGQNGDIYIDTLNSVFYAKSGGSWGDGHSMVGPTGSVPDAEGGRLTQTNSIGQIVESPVTVESHSISYNTNDNTGSRGVRSRQFGDHNFGAHFEGHKARGTASSPTAPSSGDNIVIFDGYIWDGTAWVQCGAHYLQTTEAPSSSGRGCQWRWTVVKNGTTSEVTGLVLSQAQQLLLGGITTGDASAVLQIDDTARGVLIPRLTTTQRNAISTPATGLLIFNSTATEFQFWNGTAWTPIGSGSGGVFSSIASQAEAEAGTDNTKGMTPLRVAQAITALAPSGGSSGGGSSSFSGARVYKTASQSIPSTTWTPLTFDSENYDTSSYHSTSSNSERFTIPATGYYLLSANIAYNTATAGSRWVRISKNGSTELVNNNAHPIQESGLGTFLSCSCETYLSAGDYVSCDLYQTSGSTLTTSVGDWGPHFSITRSLGPSSSGLPITHMETESYLLNENTGTTIYNAINSKSATVQGSGTFGWSTIGSNVAASFSGGKYFLISKCSDPIKMTGQMTFASLVKIPSLSATGNLQMIMSGQTNARIYLCVQTDGTLNLDIGNGTSSQDVNSSTGAIVDNTPYHVAFTHDGETIRLYINGTEVSNSPATFALSVLNAADGFNIGRYRDGASSDLHLQGLLTCARIWNRALKPSEITSLATSPNVGLS